MSPVTDVDEGEPLCLSCHRHDPCKPFEERSDGLWLRCDNAGCLVKARTTCVNFVAEAPAVADELTEEAAEAA